MSKYYKAEDVIRAFGEWFAFSETVEDIVANLPTIEVSEDCISRKWLKENAKVLGDYYENTVWAVPLSILEHAPSVVPSRAEGEWVVADDESILFTVYKCSRCGKVHASSPHNYCPNCGSRMRGEHNDE